MAFYKENFLQISEDGFITRPQYMDTHLSHNIRCTIGQIQTSSHQLEIKVKYHQKKGLAEYANTSQKQKNTTFADAQTPMRLEGDFTVFSEKVLALYPKL